MAAWLCRKAGQQFEQPQEFDDPNSTISNILDSLRKMGVTVDFAPSKLKQGHGEQAIFVLDRLSDEALRASHFQWFKPSGIPEEGADDEEDVEDEAELNLDKVEEEMAAEYSDEEDEDDILHINGEKKNIPRVTENKKQVYLQISMPVPPWPQLRRRPPPRSAPRRS